MHTQHSSTLKPTRHDLLLMLHVVLFAGWVHLLFVVACVLLLAVLWWLFSNPWVIAAGVVIYLILVLLSFVVDMPEEARSVTNDQTAE